MINKIKKEQRFANKHGLNSVYVWKQKDGYQVGINGTSHHFGGLSFESSEKKVLELINIKK